MVSPVCDRYATLTLPPAATDPWGAHLVLPAVCAPENVSLVQEHASNALAFVAAPSLGMLAKLGRMASSPGGLVVLGAGALAVASYTLMADDPPARTNGAVRSPPAKADADDISETDEADAPQPASAAGCGNDAVDEALAAIKRRIDNFAGEGSTRSRLMLTALLGPAPCDNLDRLIALTRINDPANPFAMDRVLRMAEHAVLTQQSFDQLMAKARTSDLKRALHDKVLDYILRSGKHREVARTLAGDFVNRWSRMHGDAALDALQVQILLRDGHLFERVDAELGEALSTFNWASDPRRDPNSALSRWRQAREIEPETRGAKFDLLVLASKALEEAWRWHAALSYANPVGPPIAPLDHALDDTTEFDRALKLIDDDIALASEQVQGLDEWFSRHPLRARKTYGPD
jgi:hypothetical protein